MKNQVIKVLDREHGKKVIEYWKSRGIDTGTYEGNMTEEEHDTCIYYGIIDNKFSNYGIKGVQEAHVEIITLPEERTFPRKMLVWDDDDESNAEPMEVLYKLPGNAKQPWICVKSSYMDEYLSGGSYDWDWFDKAKEIDSDEPKPIEMTMEEVCKALGKEIKIIKS